LSIARSPKLSLSCDPDHQSASITSVGLCLSLSVTYAFEVLA